MHLWIVIALLLLGIVLIVKGGDLFVDAASWMAEVSGIPKLIVGATVVSLATTLPEQLVSIMAAVQGKTDMAVGNAVGSVTANVGLILAVSVLCMPAVIRRRDYAVKSALMLGAAALLLFCGGAGQLEWGIAGILLAAFAAFLVENVSSARRSMAAEGAQAVRPPADRRTIAANLLKFALGTAGIVWGADLLVNNGSELARFIGISERVIGVTIVAVGTSLPELITTITAIVKKQSSLSVGNILGANIIDLTLILPLSSLVSGQPLPITAGFARFDLPVCLLVGSIALVPALAAGRFRRWQGVLLLAVYGVYVALTCTVMGG